MMSKFNETIYLVPIKDQIKEFKDCNFEMTEAGINKANSMLTDILIGAARGSLPFRKTVKRGHLHDKKML